LFNQENIKCIEKGDESMSIQTVVLDWVSNEPPMMFCPVCGNPITSIEDGFKECKHIVFTYLDVAGGFTYIREDCKELFKTLEKECEETGNEVIEIIADRLESESMVSISVSTTTISSRPGSITMIGCFDFKDQIGEN
jgi:hypothetical protein